MFFKTHSDIEFFQILLLRIKNFKNHSNIKFFQILLLRLKNFLKVII